MTSPTTYARGAELGFEGIDFYVAGRGGALGDVPADVVDRRVRVLLARHRRAGVGTVGDGDAAPRRPRSEWAGVLPRLGARELDAGQVDWTRARRACSAASSRNAPVAGAPLFAGWRDAARARRATPGARAPPPQRACASCAARCTARRCSRSGSRRSRRSLVRTPKMIVGVRVDRARPPTPSRSTNGGRLAEARTDRMLGRHFAVLDDDERKEFVDLLGATNR